MYTERFVIGRQGPQAQGRTWLAEDAAALVDEIPGAYKDLAQVMANQTDLVAIEHQRDRHAMDG